MRASLLSATLVALALFSGIATQDAAAQQSRSVGTNVAVVDVAHIFDNFGRFKSQMDQIKSDMENFEQYVKTEQEKLKGLSERLKDYKAGTPEFKQLEEQIVQADTNMRLQIARKRKDFLDREAQVYFQHYNEVVGHVRAIADQNGIGLVLRFSNKDMEPDKRETVLQGVNRAVVYHNGIDITGLVLDRVNRYTPPPTPPSGTGTATRPSIPTTRPR